MLKLMTNCDELMKELNENVSGKRLPKKEVDNLKWLSDAIISRLWVCPNGLILYSPKMKPRIETFKFPVNDVSFKMSNCNVCIDLIFNPDTKCYWLCDSYLSTNKPEKNEDIMYYKFYDDKDYKSRTLDRGEATQFRLIQLSLNNWIIVKRNNKSILSIKGEGNINDYQIKMKLISLKGYIGGYPLHTELYLKKNENLDSILDPIKLEEIIVET